MNAYSRVQAASLDLAADSRVIQLSATRRSLPTLTLLLWLIAALAIIAPAAIVRFGTARQSGYGLLVTIPARDERRAAPPPVDSVALRSLTMDQARVFNAAIAFSKAPIAAARQYRFTGTADDLARATDCLAAATYYEAGDDPADERAVAQVVLNRVRHPAFPKTVCGVVFQGSERTTGCQFTFACDGALVRYTPTPSGWQRAQKLASAALAGAVERAVGEATHYHTEWVVPYWQASLDKIAAVHTQLFYRWTGWWGTPPAFTRHALVGEPVVPALARVSDAHRLGVTVAAAQSATTALPVAVPLDAREASISASLGQFMVTLPAGSPASSWPTFAGYLCGTRDRCRVMAWRDKASTATVLPLELTQIAAMEFSYVRDRSAGIDRPLWNCHDVRRPDPHRCMRRQMLMTAMPIPGEQAASSPRDVIAPANAGAGPPDLAGIRRTASITPPGTSPAGAP